MSGLRGLIRVQMTVLGNGGRITGAIRIVKPSGKGIRVGWINGDDELIPDLELLNRPIGNRVLYKLEAHVGWDFVIHPRTPSQRKSGVLRGAANI